MPNAQDLLDEFKDSFLYAFFNDLTDAEILSVIDFILACPPAKLIYQECPKIFECWFLRALAIQLYAFGIGDDEGTPTVPPFEGTSLESYVKRDKVRDEEREYFPPEMKKCTNCEDTPIGMVRLQMKHFEDACEKYTATLGLYSVGKCPTSKILPCHSNKYLPR